MRPTGRPFWISLLKFSVMVMVMASLFPLLGVIAYGPISSLVVLLGGGSLLKAILTRALLVVSITQVSFVAGLLFPRDGRIVQISAVASVFLFFADSVGTEAYFALHIAQCPIPYSYMGLLAAQFLVISVLSYWFSRVLHRAGRALRPRSRE
jgi:hypothetical protein